MSLTSGSLHQLGFWTSLPAGGAYGGQCRGTSPTNWKLSQTTLPSTPSTILTYIYIYITPWLLWRKYKYIFKNNHCHHQQNQWNKNTLHKQDTPVKTFLPMSWGWDKHHQAHASYVALMLNVVGYCDDKCSETYIEQSRTEWQLWSVEKENYQ